MSRIQPHNPGLNIHHDVRSERFAVRNLPQLGIITEAFVPKSKQHRTYFKHNDQGETPRCTAFGTLTDLACTPITYPGKNPLKDPQQFYEQIQAEDRAHGRHFSEGATTVAAMECAKANGWISAYYWGWTMEIAQRTILVCPMVWGTWWYDSMFDADDEGIIRIGRNARQSGGHLYCVNGYNVRRDLWTIEQTWGSQPYGSSGFSGKRQYIPGDDLYRLLREDGEFTVITEVQPQ